MQARGLVGVVCAPCLVLLTTGMTCVKPVPPSEPALDEQRRCVELLTRRALDEATPHCQLCLEFDPFSPECHNAQGLIAFLRGDDATARQLYLQALRLKPEFAEARNNLGALELAQGDLDRAATRFASALAIAPGYADARYNLALCRLKQGQREVAHAPVADTAAAERALALYDQAEAEYLRLLALQPGHVEAQHDLCALLAHCADLATTEQARSEHLAAAEARCVQCLLRAPDHGRCLAGLAHLYRITGRCREAQAAARRCVELDAGDLGCQALLQDALGCAQAQEAAPAEASFR